MKKQKLQFLIILVILILAAAAYVLVIRYNEKTEEKEQESEAESVVWVTDFTAEEVDAFSYEVDGSTVSFTRDGDNWVYENDLTMDITEDTVTTLLNSAGVINASEVLEEVEDLSEFGLEEPANTIVITTTDETYTIYIGIYNEMLSQYYLKLDGDDKVYLVDSTTGTLFDDNIAE